MKIDANGTEIRVMGDVVNEEAYISLTDIAKYKNPDNAFIVVANWMRNHSTISFLGLWEQIHNPNFKPIEFDRFKAESGDNAFTLTHALLITLQPINHDVFFFIFINNFKTHFLIHTNRIIYLLYRKGCPSVAFIL